MRSFNDLSVTLGPFLLELQQTLEVCSRAPAIGECVCHGLVLRCHRVHDGDDDDAWSVGPRLGYSRTPLLLDVIADRPQSRREDIPHTIRSEITSRTQDCGSGVLKQRLVVVCKIRCSVCPHFQFASARSRSG